MAFRFSDKLAALMQLRDAEIEAEHDIEDGFEPEALHEQWERAVSTLDQPHRESLLLIALMSSGFAVGESVGSRSGLSDAHGCQLYAYAGLTEAGRAVALAHGWADTDEARHAG